MKFADDSKLSGVVDTSGQPPCTKNLDRLEEWTNRKLMKFNRTKYNVLYLGKHNP